MNKVHIKVYSLIISFAWYFKGFLTQAYAGFSWSTRVKKEQLCGVATGNWGCGVYNGNVELKSLLQLMAAAECNRDVAYFTFADDELRDSMHSIHQFLTDNNITVG